MPSCRLGLIALAAIVSCGAPPPPDAHLAAQWIATTHALVRAEELSAPVASRIFAYSSLAMYEAYAADPRSNLRSLAGQLNGLWSLPLASSARRIDGATVAAEVQRIVLDSLFSGGSESTQRVIDSLAQAQIARRRSAGVGADLTERSVAHARALGRVILAWAADDEYFATRGRSWSPPASGGGRWTLTSSENRSAPRTTDSGVIQAGRDMSRAAMADTRSMLPKFNATQPTEPHWGRLRTFAVRNGDECAPPAPPAYAEWHGSDFWKMGRELYDSASKATPAQRDLAVFWSDAPAASAGGLHWVDVIQRAVLRRGLSSDAAAELYALTATAMADGLIVGWREKYRSLVVRPAVFVLRTVDARWQPSSAPAPVPDYPSERALLAAATVDVIVALLRDSVGFTDSTSTGAGVRTRTFANFAQARDEAAASAIYGGVNFVPSVVQGLAVGHCVATRVAGRLRTRATPN